MPGLKCTKMIKAMGGRIFRRSQKPSGPGYIRKHQKRINMGQKGIFRTTSGHSFMKCRLQRGRRPKAAALFWERPKAATIFDENINKIVLEEAYWLIQIIVDVFLSTFSPHSFRQIPKFSTSMNFIIFNHFASGNGHAQDGLFHCNFDMCGFISFNRDRAMYMQKVGWNFECKCTEELRLVVISRTALQSVVLTFTL